MNQTVIRDEIQGARNLGSFLAMIVLLSVGTGFFLAGISSYFQINFLRITDTTTILFIPQGIAMLFYGTGAIGIGGYLFFTLLWNIGSGYNEFSKAEQLVRIIRVGFPGKNKTLFLSYDFQNIKALKLVIKQGLNPRTTIFLLLKDKREIPLFPAQFLLNPAKLEKKAIELAKFLNVPLESAFL
jgi:hypothetical protein